MNAKQVSVVIGALVLVVLLCAWTVDQPSEASAVEPRIITVTGNAQVRVVPDEVILVLGVETWNKEIKVAKDQNDARVRRVLNLVEDYGIPSRHFKTEYFDVRPGTRELYGIEVDGFWVRKNIVLTVQDLSQFEALLIDLIDSGITHVHDWQFRTTKLREHKDKARALAIQAAEDKAKALAGELGQKIGDPITIQENQMGWWYGYSSWWGSGRNNWMSQNVIQEVGAGASASGEVVAPGQIAVDATVTVTFELQH